VGGGGGVKWLRNEVKQSPLASAQVKNESAYTSSHLYAFMTQKGKAFFQVRRKSIHKYDPIFRIASPSKDLRIVVTILFSLDYINF
jgi:hypothetical protein